MPFRGPALLVSNHMSHIDGFLISACVQRRIRFMIWKPYFELKSLNWFLRRVDAIPVADRPPRRRGSHPRRAAGAGRRPRGLHLRRGRDHPHRQPAALQARPGKDRRRPRRADHPRALDRLWGSIFSFEGGRFFWKWPKRIPYPVTVSFGAPLPPDTPRARSAAGHPGARRRRHRASQDCRATRSTRASSATRAATGTSFAMADSTGRELTYGRALTAGHADRPPVARRPDDRRPAARERRRRAREPGDHAGRPRSGQPELHRRRRGDGARDRASAASAPSSRRASSPAQAADAARLRRRLHRRSGRGVRQARASCAPMLSARFAAAPPAARTPDSVGDHHLLERQHRRAERRHADALQPAREYRGHGAALLDHLAATASPASCRSSTRSASR